MTMRDLLIFFEGYYGEKYSGIFLDTVAAYLDGYSEGFYRAVARVLPLRYPRIYNKAPGPAEFEKNMDEIRSLEQRAEWKALPEPVREITDEERAEVREMIEGWKETMREKTGPMAAVLPKVLDAVNNF